MIDSKESLFDELNKFFLVSIGAVLGVLVRWHVDNYSLVNIFGAMLMGFVMGYKFKFSLQLLIGIGFCGALTTFSSWIIDCFELLLNGYYVHAASLITVPLFIGLFSSAIGHWIGFRLKSSRFF